ncbi:hypothetical protein BC830DRAFT_145983 [Chytriomyces sp. MP71]|nr:hypothetical protein BC830DRAFT_145983 [Chytriomyces sp. MP71]
MLSGLSRLSATLSASTPSAFTPASFSFNSTLWSYQQVRPYRPHTPPQHPEKSFGRSVPVRGYSPAFAYFQLKDILVQSKVRETVRYQEWHESNPEKRRRKRKQADWRSYMEFVKKQVVLAKDLAKREKLERENYKDI